MTGRPALLLDYHDGWPGRRESVQVVESGNDTLKLDGYVSDPSADVSEGTNEYDWATVELHPRDLAEGLVRVQQGAEWSHGQVRLHGQYFEVGNRGIHSPGPAYVKLSERRRDLLLLDVYDSAYSAGGPARTGTMEPAGELDRAFLGSLRRHPDRLAELRRGGFERTVLTLLSEANAPGVRLEAVGRTGDLWLVRPRDGAMPAMLLSIEPGPDGAVGIDVVDRINGVRDRSLVSKAAIVTRSRFSSDVSNSYGALSQRMELVDYDRLSGILTDSGWICRTPGYLVCPVQPRPEHLVFISYSWAQRDFAVWLFNQLDGWHYRCFLDSVDLDPGDVILSAIKQALAGADAVLLCCSPEALSSSWVRAEIDYCLDREGRTGRPMLVPLLLPGSDLDQVRAVLGDRLCADFRDWHPAAAPGHPLEKLRTAVEGIIKIGS